MVAPALALPLAGGAAAALGSLAGGGGGTQEQNRYDTQVRRTYSPTTTTNTTTTDNRQITISPQRSNKVNYNPQVIVDSPDASVGSKLSQKSKKGGASPEQKAPVTTPVTSRPDFSGDQQTGDQGAKQAGGKDTLVLLGLVAAGAYVLND